MLTLVFGRFVSEAMANSSLDLGLIAKETTLLYGHKFVYILPVLTELQHIYETCNIESQIQ